jgi:hypothetical protein
MYNKKDLRAFFFTKEGLALYYWSVLSLSLLNSFALVVSVVVSTYLLISWLRCHPKLEVSNIHFFLIGLLMHMIGAPFLADSENITFLEIGTAILFFSRLFIFLYFYFHLHYVNYFTFRNLLFVLPFVVSLVFSYFFLSQVLPEGILFFAIPQTFVDSLLVSSIPALTYNGRLKKFYVFVITFMALLDHLGGYYLYSSSSEITILVVRICSAFLKLFLTFLVFDIETNRK